MSSLSGCPNRHMSIAFLIGDEFYGGTTDENSRSTLFTSTVYLAHACHNANVPTHMRWLKCPQNSVITCSPVALFISRLCFFSASSLFLHCFSSASSLLLFLSHLFFSPLFWPLSSLLALLFSFIVFLLLCVWSFVSHMTCRRKQESLERWEWPFCHFARVCFLLFRLMCCPQFCACTHRNGHTTRKKTTKPQTWCNDTRKQRPTQQTHHQKWRCRHVSVDAGLQQQAHNSPIEQTSKASVCAVAICVPRFGLLRRSSSRAPPAAWLTTSRPCSACCLLFLGPSSRVSQNVSANSSAPSTRVRGRTMCRRAHWISPMWRVNLSLRLVRDCGVGFALRDDGGGDCVREVGGDALGCRSGGARVFLR